MSQKQMAQFCRGDLLRHCGGGIIRKVTMPAENSLFETPWPVWIVLKHFRIVVGFQHKHMGRSDAVQDQLGRMSEVRQKPDVYSIHSQQQTDGVIRVMG